MLDYVGKKICIPSRSALLLWALNPWNLYFRGCLSYPLLKPMNFNYFFLVKNVLEESIIQHDLIILNTAIYCATKEPIDNQTFIHEPTTIVI